MESNRSLLEQAMLDDGMAILAGDWAAGAEEAEDEEAECYIMEDGQKVFVPVTPDDFCRSLYPQSVCLLFCNGWDKPYMTVGLGCAPDYFAGHSIMVSVNADKRICCDGLAG